MSKRIKNELREFVPENMPEFLMPHIELCSNQRATVEGCKGILCYNSTCVKLNCKNKVMAFGGENLSLTSLCNEQITVSGEIFHIAFES